MDNVQSGSGAPGGRPVITKQDMRVLSDLSRYNCAAFEPFVAFIYESPTGDDPLLYSNVELAREASQLAAGLQGIGIEKGDRVIVMMFNGPQVVIAYQAIARAGAIIIPVLPLLKGPEVRFIVENSGAKAIFTNNLFLPTLQQAIGTLSTMQAFIGVGDLSNFSDFQSKGQLYAYPDLVERGQDHAEDYLTSSALVDIEPDDAAAILYTSGTTGQPKGVVLTHRNLVANALSGFTNISKDGVQETQLSILPLAHAYGIISSNVSFLNGAQSVMQPRFDPTAVLKAIERYKISSFAGVPAMFVALLYAPDADKYDTSSLTYCVSGSAPLPLAILTAFEQKFHCKILEGYGLSEASAMLTGHSITMLQKPGSVGKAVEGVDLRIVDDNDQSLPKGEVGEIIARGSNIMQGYYQLPAETSLTMRNGWLHTGDMGYLDEDDYLYIVERKKDLIIRGGFNVYPRDIEEVLNNHPAVLESAVIGVPSELMGEEVKAFVVRRNPVDAEELMAYSRQLLANYKTPSRITFVDELPRNAIGKIDKKILRQQHNL